MKILRKSKQNSRRSCACCLMHIHPSRTHSAPKRWVLYPDAFCISIHRVTCMHIVFSSSTHRAPVLDVYLSISHTHAHRAPKRRVSIRRLPYAPFVCPSDKHCAPATNVYLSTVPVVCPNNTY